MLVGLLLLVSARDNSKLSPPQIWLRLHTVECIKQYDHAANSTDAFYALVATKVGPKGPIDVRRIPPTSAPPGELPWNSGTASLPSWAIKTGQRIQPGATFFRGTLNPDQPTQVAIFFLSQMDTPDPITDLKDVLGETPREWVPQEISTRFQGALRHGAENPDGLLGWAKWTFGTKNPYGDYTSPGICPDTMPGMDGSIFFRVCDGPKDASGKDYQYDRANYGYFCRTTYDGPH